LLKNEFKSSDLIGFSITVVFARLTAREGEVSSPSLIAVLNNGYGVSGVFPNGVTALTASWKWKKTCFG
jgi:hypothetical protein